jgi:hypothetical protein
LIDAALSESSTLETLVVLLELPTILS